MKKVYIVTSGEYSDYHIDAVFSAKEKAEEFADIVGTGFEVEEYDLDAQFERKTVVYLVSFSDRYGCEASIEEYLNPDTVEYSESFGDKRYTFTILCDSSKKAVKIASERLAQIKAMPYMFPKLMQKCYCENDELFGTHRKYPTYNYKTREIVIEDGHWIEE